MHGDHNKLLLPTLAEEIAATARFNDALTHEDLSAFVNLLGRVVISRGRQMGTSELAHSSLNHGCSAYIGPEGAPLGYASMLVSIFLFYELTEMRSLEEAVEGLRQHDYELAMWRLLL